MKFFFSVFMSVYSISGGRFDRNTMITFGRNLDVFSAFWKLFLETLFTYALRKINGKQKNLRIIDFEQYYFVFF